MLRGNPTEAAVSTEAGMSQAAAAAARCADAATTEAATSPAAGAARGAAGRAAHNHNTRLSMLPGGSKLNIYHLSDF